MSAVTIEPVQELETLPLLNLVQPSQTQESLPSDSIAQEYNTTKNMFDSFEVGETVSVISDIIQTKHLLIVGNPLEAIALAGANLLASSGWCVVCQSQKENKYTNLFYKSMSFMGVYEYYYGYGSDNKLLNVLNSDRRWCTVATTINDKIADLQKIFVKNNILLIESGDVKLQPKINRYKTFINQDIEAFFQEGEDLTFKKSQLPYKQLGGEITTSQISELHTLLAPETFAEFTKREDFTIPNILYKMIESSGVDASGNPEFKQNILYVPLDTTSSENYSLLKTVIGQGRGIDLDFVFVDNRPEPEIVEQYFYRVDLTQPILLRNNPRTRKLIAFLNNIEELETFFREGYQFLTSLRMIPLSRTVLESIYNSKISVGPEQALQPPQAPQAGGQFENEYEDEFENEYKDDEDNNNDLMTHIVRPTDIVFPVGESPQQVQQPGFLESLLPTVGGRQKRSSRKQSRRKGQK